MLVKMLVARGVNVNVTNAEGVSALMLAALNGDDDLVKFLIDNGADINATNKKKENALFNAAKKGHTQTALLLLKSGINPHAENENGIRADTIALQGKYKGTADLIQEARRTTAPVPTPSPAAASRAPSNAVFKSAPGTEVHFLGVYQSAKETSSPLPAGIKGNRHGDIQVAIHRKGVPIILVLTSYEPVRWVLMPEEGVNIAGIILSGYYRQTVTGAASTIPVLSTSYVQPQTNVPYFYSYDEKSPDLTMHKVRIQGLTGVPYPKIYFPGRRSAAQFDIR